MDIDIHELLLSQKPAQVISKIEKFMKNNKTTQNDLNRSIVQLLIFLSDKDHELEDDELSRLEKENTGKQIISETFSSDRKDENVLQEVQAEFFDKFLRKGISSKIINSTTIKLMINFLELSVTNEFIPPNSTFRMNCFLILKNLLMPISFLTTLNFEDSSLGEEIERAFDVILNQIPNSLEFKKISTEVAREIINVTEKNHQIVLCEDCKILDSYVKMMTIDDNFLQMTAIKSLKKLISIESVQEEISRFFYDDNNGRSELVMNAIYELLNKKMLKYEIITLIQSIQAIDSSPPFISDDLKFDIYTNIFGGVKKLITPVAEMIITNEEDFWTIIIDLLDSFDISVNLENFISSVMAIEGAELDEDKILSLLESYKNDHSKQAITAAIFSEYLKINPQSIGRIDDAMTHCSTNESAFTVILEGIIRGGRTTLFTEILLNNTDKVISIFECMMKLSETVDNILILSSIMEVLRILTKMSPEYVQQQCRVSLQNFKQEINECLQSKSDVINPIKRLMMLLENHTMNLMTPTDVVELIKILEDLIQNSGNFDNYITNLPTYIRCYVNFIKSLWSKLVLGHPTGLNIHRLASDIKDVCNEVKNKCLNDNMTLKDGLLMLTSYFDLLTFFQPSMTLKYPNNIFNEVTFNLTKEDVKSLAKVVEELVFHVKEDDNTHSTEYKKLIMNKWICLCKYYDKFPSTTASEKFLRHYNNTCQLKEELEENMKYLMQTKEGLEKTIAFAILNLSNLQETKSFKSFFIAFDDFLIRNDEKGRTMKLLSIATFILKKLPQHIKEGEKDRRFLILEFISTVLDGLDTRVKSKLKAFLPKDVKSFNLTAKEQKQLKDFSAQFEQSSD